MEDLPKIKPFYAADCSNWLTQSSCDGNIQRIAAAFPTLPEPPGATNTENPYSLCLYTVDKK
jgi:hypothetical protein